MGNFLDKAGTSYLVSKILDKIKGLKTELTVTNISIYVDKDNWVLDPNTNLYKNIITVNGLDDNSYCELGLACAGETPSKVESESFNLIVSGKTTIDTLTLYAIKKLPAHIVIVIKV